MAGPRFRRRIPTLEEMEKADQIEASSRLGSFQKEEKSSDSAKVTPNGQSTISAQPPQSSPPKRMVSQKSLLSRQPLSRQTHSTKSKIFPKSGDPTSDKTEVRNRSNISGSVQDFERCPQVFQVTHGNITSQVNETSSVTPTAPASVGFKETHQINARISSATLEQYDGEVGHSGQPAMLEPNDHKLKQPCEEENNIRADVLPTLAKLGKTNSLVVNPRQRGNPILNFVRNVPWEFGNVVPDYVMGQSNCALYLSLRYHQLHPDYIHMRLKQLGHSFDLRVLLVQVDIKDPHHLLKDLAKICILADCTLMLAFSTEEAGRYLETYKVYENKAAEAIMERTDNNFNVQLSDCLTRVKPVNKTDCSTLLATFGSLQSIMASSAEDLSLCPGFGPQKAKSLHDVFHEPFLVSKKQRADTAI